MRVKSQTAWTHWSVVFLLLLCVRASRFQVREMRPPQIVQWAMHFAFVQRSSLKLLIDRSISKVMAGAWKERANYVALFTHSGDLACALPVAKVY